MIKFEKLVGKWKKFLQLMKSVLFGETFSINPDSFHQKGDYLYLHVGKYIPADKNNGQEVIEKEYYREGNIFKDAYAFLNNPEEVCYIPELSDAKYTRNDFLRICNGQVSFAEELFDQVDWQHPETVYEDFFINGEWGQCHYCNMLYHDNYDSVEECPHCGKRIFST